MKELHTPQTYSKILHWVWAERCFVLHRGAHLSAVKSQVIRVVVSRILLFSSAFTEISDAPHQLLLSQWFWLSGSCGKRWELLFFYSPPIMHPQHYHSRWHLKGLIFFYMCYQSFAALSQLPEERPCFFFHLQEHSQMIPLGSPHWFLSLIPTFKAETEKEERSCMCVFVCVCVCQDSVSKCHGKRFMSLGGLVLNPTGMIEGSLNSDRFSKITTQRGRLRRTEKEKAKDSERR